MPDEIMKNMHETGMASGHHWLFWVVVVTGVAVTILLTWWLFGRNSK